MRIANPVNTVKPATHSLCPRRYWRSVNPAPPPPESPTCLARGPDCCVTSAVASARRAA